MTSWGRNLSRALAFAAVLALAAHSDGAEDHSHLSHRTQHCCLCHTPVGSAAAQPDVSPAVFIYSFKPVFETTGMPVFNLSAEFSRGPPSLLLP